MGPPDHGKAVSTSTNGPRVCLPGSFPTALNGPTGACKAGIDVHEWVQERLLPTALKGPTKSWKGGIDVYEWVHCFPPEIVSDCFEWAYLIMESRHRCSRIAPVEIVSDCFEWAHQIMERRYRRSRMGPGFASRDRFRLL